MGKGLESIISRTRGCARIIPTSSGQVAGAMLLALGAAIVSPEGWVNGSLGDQPDRPATQPDNKAGAISPAEFEVLLTQLDDKEYAVRQAAERRLIEGGKPWVDKLRQQLDSKKLAPEAEWRVRRVLQELQPALAMPESKVVTIGGAVLQLQGADITFGLVQDATIGQLQVGNMMVIQGGRTLTVTGPPVSVPASQPADEVPPIAPAEFETLLMRLDDREYAVRQAAERRLVESGRRWVDKLHLELDSKKLPPEAEWRVRRVLQELQP